MSTIQQYDSQINQKMKHFNKLVHFSEILHQSNLKKTHGVATTKLFQWMIGSIFSRYSIERNPENTDFTRKTVRNCLNTATINWQRIVGLVATNLILYVLHFTAKDRQRALIIDDTLFKREFSKKTEMLAKVFDHDNQQFFRGFRGLTIGWSDGNTFLPVNFALMSSKKTSNQIGPMAAKDKRTLAYARRMQSRRSMNEVALELVKDSLKFGIKAKYVLFDSWYSSPKMFYALNQLGCDGIGMFKKTKKVHFRYRKREMDVKSLHDRLCRSKSPQHKNYQYSPIVTFNVNGQEMKMKLVFITNRNNKDDYLVLGTTKTSLSPSSIVQLYARRWQIEGFFKMTKQYLRFDKTQVQKFDGLYGHIAMVMLSYDVLALNQREDIDERTLGDLFYDFGQPLPDIQVITALNQLMTLLIGLGDIWENSKTIIAEIVDTFVQGLPNDLSELLITV